MCNEDIRDRLSKIYAGVTTIAGGKAMRGGHIDGPSDDAKFSTDFEIRYISSSCSLLVIDRGNQAIREIPLQPDDCEYQDEAAFPLGTFHLRFPIVLFHQTVVTSMLMRKSSTKTTNANYFSLNTYRCCLAFCCCFLRLHACVSSAPSFRNGINNRGRCFKLYLLF
jgi:hypothetical protein